MAHMRKENTQPKEGAGVYTWATLCLRVSRADIHFSFESILSLGPQNGTWHTKERHGTSGHTI